MSDTYKQLKTTILNATATLGVKSTIETLTHELNLKGQFQTFISGAKYAIATSCKAAVSYSNDAIDSITTQYSVAKEVVSSIVDNSLESASTNYVVAKDFVVNNSAQTSEALSTLSTKAQETAVTNFEIAKDFFISNVDTAKEVAQVALNTTVEYVQENSTPILIAAGIGMGACALGYCAYNYFNNKELVEDNNESGFFSSLLSYIE
jgi:hypothetical protein